MAEPAPLTPQLPDALLQRLEGWLETGELAALDAACDWVRTHAVDVGVLLGWLEEHAPDRDAGERAQRRLRFALGLPVVPGPVCRR